MKPRLILAIRGDSQFSELLRKSGFKVENLELIRTEPLADQSEFRARLQRLSEYDGLFLTSPAAADVFAKEVSAGTKFEGKIFALGERARNVLQDAGFEIACDDTANTSEEMIESLDPLEFAGKKLLFVRGNRSMRTVVERLDGRAVVEEVVVYETRRLEPDEDTLLDLRSRLSGGEIDWICFFSPSGVDAFCEFFIAKKVKAKIATIGETTAKKIKDAGLAVNLISTKATAEAFAKELSEQIKKS
jgi:uroporphyrinogen-III synthase